MGWEVKPYLSILNCSVARATARARLEEQQEIRVAGVEGEGKLGGAEMCLYFFALIPEEGFLISPGYSLELCIQMQRNREKQQNGKDRDLFKKIRDIKGTFQAKMGSIKDRNGMDLTEAEDIKKRWQEYTEELYKKDLHDPDNHDGVITHLEPDILECEFKWALESITTNKASGCDEIPVELFQSLKDDAVKVLHSICQQIWKTQQWPQD